MAEVTQTRVLPPEFVEAAGKTYLSNLADATGQYKTADLSKAFGQQFVAGQDPLQAQAQQLATQGIGAYQPFLNQAAAAQTTAGGLTGPQAYQQFMSPYQQDVISETLREFDVQAQKGIPSIAAQAVSKGVLGGGREGVMRSEYQATSDRNRAALQAQLLKQVFVQAQQSAGQAFGQQQALANQQQALANQQLNLAQAAPAFASQQIAGLSTLGGLQQAQTQAGLAAQQQLAQAQAQQPIQAAQTLGSGIMGLISGYPGQVQQTVQPTPSPLQTALSTGATLAGLYKGFSDL